MNLGNANRAWKGLRLLALAGAGLMLWTSAPAIAQGPPSHAKAWGYRRKQQQQSRYRYGNESYGRRYDSNYRNRRDWDDDCDDRRVSSAELRRQREREQAWARRQQDLERQRRAEYNRDRYSRDRYDRDRYDRYDRYDRDDRYGNYGGLGSLGDLANLGNLGGLGRGSDVGDLLGSLLRGR